MRSPLLAPLVAVLLCAAPAFAMDRAQYTYQDGVLKGFHREPAEENCIAGSNASASPSRARSDACPGKYDIVYIVESGGAIYILTPRGDLDKANCGLLTRATIAHSVLDHQPPLTPIKLRSDGKHFFVKIGNRESEYSVARVE